MSNEKRLSESFLAECRRFERCNDASSASRSEIGLRQFHTYESRGTMPEAPDPYFVRLLDGKKWWEWTLNYYADQLRNNGGQEWPGWFQITEDWQDDPAGLRQIARRCGFPLPERAA